MKSFLSLFCRHNSVIVRRYHKDCVPPEWKPKVLYVDELDVWNFVECAKCRTTLYGTIKEHMFRSKKD